MIGREGPVIFVGENSMAVVPKYLRDFREYAREEPTNDDLPAMESEFYGESDRAVAVLQGAALDIALQAAIRKTLRHDLPADVVTEIFNSDRLLNTFSAKIIMGFALNIFGPKTVTTHPRRSGWDEDRVAGESITEGLESGTSVQPACGDDG
jgi:hypothetical protein